MRCSDQAAHFIGMNAITPQSKASFGPFTLVPARQLLLDGEVPVRLGSRALALLCALVERAGAVVSRDELVATVWPTTVVEETSLRVQVAALRKVLGEGERGQRYIINVVGRGYSFVAPVTWRHATHPADVPEEPSRRHNLPSRLTRPIGRDEVVDALGSQIGRRRLVSIVGPGGIGKTTVALAVAEIALSTFEDGVFFVDLAPLSDPKAVSSALLAMLAVSAPPDDALPALRAFLRERRMLLVFDNCEHLIEAVARLADGLVRTCADLHVLTTSREPLNVEGEWVHRQTALATPDPAELLNVATAYDYPSIRLFVERATSNSDSFVLTDANLGAVRQVCCRLDGMPLAIELAAARVESLGVQGLAERLDNLLSVLSQGRRTGDPRHRALKAVLDWSHDLLSDGERKVLRRLSVFRAAFTLESASHVAAGEEIDGAAVVEHLLSLIDKSLVTANTDHDVAHYRLLYATRKFAELQLSASGEAPALARRHAQHFYDEIVARRKDPRAFGSPQLLAFTELTFEDVDAAIQWALSEPGAGGLGIQLALACSASDLGFLDRQLVRFEQVIRHVTGLNPAMPELELEANANWSLFSGGSNAFELRQEEVFARLLTQMSGVSPADRAACFQGMSIGAFGQGNYLTSLRFADEQGALGDQPMAARQAERLQALNYHFLGRQQAARKLTQALVDEVLTTARAPLLASARRSFSMRLVMARILWLQGHVDQAAAMAEAALADSVQAHPFARCKALGLAAVPVALWRGDLDVAQTANRQLRDLANRHSLGYWQSWVGHFDKIVAARRAGEPVCSGLPDEVDRHFPRGNPTEADALPTFAEELLTEQALARVERGEVGWCAPETLRVHGVALFRNGGLAEAEAIFERSLALSRSQGTLSWELRTACSLARLWGGQDRQQDAQALLGSTYTRFTEGHGTADLVAARDLLVEIGAPMDQFMMNASRSALS
jgi:predicted ATPase/DNA-binding winged helix-turn-helix (wHTH) protein